MVFCGTDNDAGSKVASGRGVNVPSTINSKKGLHLLVNRVYLHCYNANALYLRAFLFVENAIVIHKNTLISRLLNRVVTLTR